VSLHQPFTGKRGVRREGGKKGGGKFRCTIFLIGFMDRRKKKKPASLYKTARGGGGKKRGAWAILVTTATSCKVGKGGRKNQASLPQNRKRGTSRVERKGKKRSLLQSPLDSLKGGGKVTLRFLSAGKKTSRYHNRVKKKRKATRSLCFSVRRKEKEAALRPRAARRSKEERRKAPPFTIDHPRRRIGIVFHDDVQTSHCQNGGPARREGEEEGGRGETTGCRSRWTEEGKKKKGEEGRISLPEKRVNLHDRGGGKRDGGRGHPFPRLLSGIQKKGGGGQSLPTTLCRIAQAGQKGKEGKNPYFHRKKKRLDYHEEGPTGDNLNRIGGRGEKKEPGSIIVKEREA